MNLTPAQKATLKTHVTGNSDTNTLYVGGDTEGLAAILNVTASPAFWAWRTAVTKAEFVQSTSVDGTTFNWTGTGFITRAVGERDAWRELFNGEGYCNPSLASVRQAFSDIYSGATAPAPANRTHLNAVARRTVTRCERLYVTGTGSIGSPGFSVVEGLITPFDLIGL